MVCADTFRAGAFDQLKQNATRIKVNNRLILGSIFRQLYRGRSSKNSRRRCR